MTGSSEAFSISKLEKFSLLGDPLMSVLYLRIGTDGFDVQLDTGRNWVLLQEAIEWLKVLPEG